MEGRVGALVLGGVLVLLVAYTSALTCYECMETSVAGTKNSTGEDASCTKAYNKTCAAGETECGAFTTSGNVAGVAYTTEGKGCIAPANATCDWIKNLVTGNNASMYSDYKCTKSTCKKDLCNSASTFSTTLPLLLVAAVAAFRL